MGSIAIATTTLESPISQSASLSPSLPCSPALPPLAFTDIPIDARGCYIWNSLFVRSAKIGSDLMLSEWPELWLEPVTFRLRNTMNPKSNASQSAESSFSMEDFAKALEQHDYQFQQGQVVRGKVFEFDKDGAYIDIGGKSAAFLPLREASLKAIDDLSEAVEIGEEREFLVVREQNYEGQVTLSIRQMELKRTWDRLVELQEESQSLQVRVTGTNKGGVTVDVEGLRGFIPRSHLVERGDLEALVGQPLTVSFLEVDRDRKKLVLSQRNAAKATRLSSIAEGQVVEGEVVNLKPYGAFVDLGGVTGLLHIRQISQNRIDSLSDFLSEGQKIKVVVAEVDEWKGRISLATRVLENYAGELLENFDEVMANAETRWEQKKSADAAPTPKSEVKAEEE